MATFLLRVELPDRPGALGAVASRIGAVRGDLVAVEVVGHRDGKAIDEFVVELADEDHLSLLLSEVREVDGVSLQDVRPVSGRRHDRRLEAYTTALLILKERTPHGVLGALASRVCAEIDATWSAVLDIEGLNVIASQGRPPATPWLAASLTEARAAGAEPGRGRVTEAAKWGSSIWSPGTWCSQRDDPDGASAPASGSISPRWGSSPTRGGPTCTRARPGSHTRAAPADGVARGSGSALGTVGVEQLQEGSHAEAGAALGEDPVVLVRACRAGDVEVHPRDPVDESGQEEGGCDGARLTGLADVLHVGDLRVDVRPVLVGERAAAMSLHRPDRTRRAHAR